eukprot:GFUD01123384.1.p1 GENE.GFUD01123384.1~~GFUD01123384.1.p1  ORF type:complete len:133 (-),score=38.78 GFUD01123384.1:17-376(-)
MAGLFRGRRKNCLNGASCSFLARGSCFYEHSEHEKDLVELKKKSVDQMRVWELCKVGDIMGLKEALAREGEDVNSSDSEGNTGLMWAIENYDDAMVKLLVETAGIELNKKNKEEKTALP